MDRMANDFIRIFKSVFEPKHTHKLDSNTYIQNPARSLWWRQNDTVNEKWFSFIFSPKERERGIDKIILGYAHFAFTKRLQVVSRLYSFLLSFYFVTLNYSRSSAFFTLHKACKRNFLYILCLWIFSHMNFWVLCTDVRPTKLWMRAPLVILYDTKMTLTRSFHPTTTLI